MKTQPCSQKILNKKHIPVTVLKPSPLQNNPELCWLGLFSLFPKRSSSLRKGEVMGYCKTSLEGIGGVRRADKWCMSHTQMGCSHPPAPSHSRSRTATSAQALYQCWLSRGRIEGEGCARLPRDETEQHFLHDTSLQDEKKEFPLLDVGALQ